MTCETTMICDACSRVIDGVSSALAETLRGPSGDDAVDLCDWCIDGVREFLKQKRTKAAKPSSVVDGCSKSELDACRACGIPVPGTVYPGDESLNFDTVTSALEQPQDAPVFKPGKPIKPTMMKEPDIEQVSRIMDFERIRLECDVARLEGVIEGMKKGKEMMGKGGKPDDATAMEEPNLHRHAATMLGAENDALWSHVRKCRKSRAVKEALDRRNAEVAALLPAGSVVVSVAHPVLPATVYLVFSSGSIPDVVVVYGDEKLTVAAVADLIRTRVKP